MITTDCRFHVFRLRPGEDLKAAIRDYVAAHGIAAGWIVTAVGSLTEVHLRYANQREGTRLQGHYEILSLSGTVSTAGLHLHLCVSDEQGHTRGGHLLDDNRIYTTAEIVLGEGPALQFTREHDGSTAWPELHVHPRTP